MSQIPDLVSVHAICLAGRALDGEIASALGWMSPDEREQHSRFRFDRHRREFALSRFILRGILGQLTGCDPAQVELRRCPDGKPYLDGGAAPSFNLTHTDDLVALVTGPPGSSLGLDAEPLGREFDSALLNHVFDDDERRRIAAARDGEALPVSYWTAKEAYLKQIGAGLSIEPKRLSLRPRRPGGLGVFLDGRLDSRTVLHFATLGSHRLCAATENLVAPRLYVYCGTEWRREDGLWSPSAACETKSPTAHGG